MILIHERLRPRLESFCLPGESRIGSILQLQGGNLTFSMASQQTFCDIVRTSTLTLRGWVLMMKKICFISIGSNELASQANARSDIIDRFTRTNHRIEQKNCFGYLRRL